MTKAQAEDMIKKRGFQVWAVLNTKMFQAIDRWGINLYVDWEEDIFSLGWNIPETIFNLSCPACSPFSSQAQFEKIYFRFKRQVRKLKEEGDFNDGNEN